MDKPSDSSRPDPTLHGPGAALEDAHKALTFASHSPSRHMAGSLRPMQFEAYCLWMNRIPCRNDVRESDFSQSAASTACSVTIANCKCTKGGQLGHRCMESLGGKSTVPLDVIEPTLLRSASGSHSGSAATTGRVEHRESKQSTLSVTPMSIHAKGSERREIQRTDSEARVCSRQNTPGHIQVKPQQQQPALRHFPPMSSTVRDEYLKWAEMKDDRAELDRLFRNEPGST